MTIVFLVFFFIFLYICIGAVVTYVLGCLYTNNTLAYYDKDNGYFVVIGIFWLFTAPFAFALFFAKYGFPKSKEKR